MPRIRPSSSSSSAAALAAVLLLAAPGRSAADTRGWTLCTPGGFHSCHSVAITTVAIMSGTIRTGTGVSISVRNLNGSYPADNTVWSGLFAVYFVGRTTSTDPTDILNVTPTLTGPGASGTPLSWNAIYGTFAGTGTRHRSVAVSTPTHTTDLGGCAPGPSGNPSFFTCGAGATAVFTFNASQIFDAGGFDAVSIDAVGGLPSGPSGGFCFSDPSQYTGPGPPAGGYPQCDVQSQFYNPDVVPEPITIALLGTGLLGVGAARLRRRKDTGDAGAGPPSV